MISWFAKNDIAANFLLIAILGWGIWSGFEKIPYEVQPTFKPDRIYVTVNYRGGSPDDVDKSVVLPIESALEGLNGIKSIESRADTGTARITIYTEASINLQDLREEIKTRIDRIQSFPQEIDPPDISIPDSNLWFDVIKIAVVADMDEADLHSAARSVADDLIALPGISQANILGASPFEIGIEVDPRSLRDYGLTFSDLTEAIRRSSLDLPAGRIFTDEGRLTIRSKGQAYTREEFENITIKNRSGSELKLSAVAKISDGFEENKKILRFNGKPCLLIEVLRLGDENALEIADAVNKYVSRSEQKFPQGISIHAWDDSSEELRGRLGTLLNSMFQGGLLVLIVLGLFLRPMLAIWVTLGIPIAFAGGLITMPFLGITANVMSLFGFIIVIGLVVDDAIVTAENVYYKLNQGIEPLEATITGTHEVAVPVTFGALTTIVAFIPLMFFEGFYGNLTKQIPPIVAAVLIFSLIESKLSLPSHLKYIRALPTKLNTLQRFQKRIADSLEIFVSKIYEPCLRAATKHRYISISIFISFGLASLGYFTSGRMGFVNMPSIDGNRIVASLHMPRDSTIYDTEVRTRQVVDAIDQLKKEFVDPGTGKSLITDYVSSSGGFPHRNEIDPNSGCVIIGVTDPAERSTPGPKNSEIAKRWTQLIGEMPEVNNFWISGDRGNRMGSDNDDKYLTIEVRGPDSDEKDLVVEEVIAQLKSYKEGIQDAYSFAGGTSDELLITIRPEGQALGLTQRELARQVRAAFFGEEAQRIQRERDDLRVMIRMPKEQRTSLATLDNLRIRTPSGGEAPFHTIATARFEKARSRIERLDGAETIKIFAEPVDENVDVVAISKDLATKLDAIFDKHPKLTWRYSGYVAEHEETKKRTIYGGLALFFGLYALLAIPFRSLYQPIFVLLAVPFGAIGALFGHIIMDITPSYLSIFGILALAGVVVNDSLVMVDFINRNKDSGIGLFEAVIQSGTRRFRPIFLTSATTFAGLVPLLFDKSLQAQLLIPMATSLAFGIVFATLITLFLVPCSYLVAEEIRAKLAKAFRWFFTNDKETHAIAQNSAQS